ncbi:flavodoxin [uncultured Oscillibacter sp.]|uniref:flavodoxin n=1 Tax=uncultured Oscillibacter sp. TaxID=876091 RepID=UPI00262B077F|nr:flavodoxin [uncultured Oscillibacter sp.]
MNKLFALILAWAMLAALVSCGTNTGNTSSTETGSLNETAFQEGQEDRNEAMPPNEAVSPVSSDTNVLIAYFSRVGNTDFPEDVDAVSSASLLRKDGALYGNTQYVAALIQQATGGDLFLIETEEKYPADYDETDQLGGKENRERSRPALASHVDDIADYDMIYLGYPNWYYDMPMAVYAFLEEYDLSGKTIIPFVTSGGGGFSKSISEIQSLQPNAEVLTEGYKVTHSKVDDVTLEDIEQWLDSLEISG